MAAPSVESIQKSKKYLESRYGIKLTDKQTRRYRFILGDAEGAIVNIGRKVGVGNQQMDERFLSMIAKSTPGYKELESLLHATPTATDIVDAVRRDFNEAVSYPLAKKMDKKAFNGLVEWMDKWTSGEALTQIRGAMYRTASENLRSAGVLDEPNDGQSEEEAKTHDPAWQYESLIEMLRGNHRIGFAKTAAEGSCGEKLKREEMEPGYHEDHLYMECARAMLDDLITLNPSGDSEQYSEALETWLRYWTTKAGRNYISRIVAQKRYAARHKTMKVTVYEADKKALDDIRNDGGLSSQSEAFEKVMEFYRKHHG